jgi:hypothetical protein
MDLQRPIMDQVPNVAANARESITTGAKNAFDSVTNAAANVRNTLGEFGTSASNIATGASNSVTGALSGTSDAASSNFLDLNGVVAKIAFLVLVLFAFLALLRLGISAVGYFMRPSNSPYLVKGLLNGTSTTTISQDPSNTSAVPISRSNDASKGIEYTWSVWLNINQTADAATTAVWHPVFVKGEGNYDATNMCTINGPGMYLRTDANGVCTLRYRMDNVSGTGHTDMEIPNIPQLKWVHVAARLQNTILSIYVNGVVALQTTMEAAPSQNFYDVHVCPNGGFSGSLADLRYFDQALGIFGINNILMFGPNTSPSALTTDSKAVGGNFSYLSNLWYQ